MLDKKLGHKVKSRGGGGGGGTFCNIITEYYSLNFCRSVCLNVILHEFANGLHVIKTRTPSFILEERFGHFRDHIFSPIILKFALNVCLDRILDLHEFANGLHVIKTRTTSFILEKRFGHFRDHIFSPIILKFALNVCLDRILDLYEFGLY